MEASYNENAAFIEYFCCPFHVSMKRTRNGLDIDGLTTFLAFRDFVMVASDRLFIMMERVLSTDQAVDATHH